MKILALVLVALQFMATFHVAMTLGKPRDPYSTQHLAASYIIDVVVVALCGRIWGWW